MAWWVGERRTARREIRREIVRLLGGREVDDFGGEGCAAGQVRD